MRHSIGFQKRLFATLAVMIFFAHGDARAQTNLEYNFNVQSVGDRITYGGTNSDPSAILSMGCLAANGYGQWTLSSTFGMGYLSLGVGSGTILGEDEFPIGWYLLENALRKPSLSYDSAHDEPGCIPPGVVQSGPLSGSFYPKEPKASANLDTWINYAWPDSTDRSKFDIQFFNGADIDLSAKFCTNPTVGKMNIITASAIHSISVSTEDSGGNVHNIDTEADYRDEFDETIDANYRYIVWASNVNPVNPGMKEIWAMVVPLGSSTPAIMPFFVGDGKFPTVACNARNNRVLPHTPKFYVGYINPSGLPVDVLYTNSTPTPLLLNLDFISPFELGPCDGCPTQDTITRVTHVRAMVSEVAGAETDNAGMYLIAYTANSITWPNEATTEGLFLYPHLDSSTPTQPYLCDGPIIPTTDPMNIWYTTSVVDEPITAICDPYDNQNKPGYEGFHCIYRITVMDWMDTIREPLMIMKAWYNGSTNPDTTIDTRLMFTPPVSGFDSIPIFFWPPPVNHGYVAAVNQMGIHVHWRSGTLGSGAHYYARDMNRTFDEPIEENTLVTDLCQVTDGSLSGTNHGGTPGAELLPGKKMLVWTDPNYGANPANANSGLYQPADPNTSEPNAWWGGTALTYPPVGTLQIGGIVPQTTAIKLSIGDQDSVHQGAMFSVMPNFYILFNGRSQAYGQSLVVNGGDSLNYYGVWGRRSTYTIPVLGGVSQNWMYLSYGALQVAQSPGDRSGEGLIDLEGTSTNLANLIVHGGSDFHIGEDAYFFSRYGNIQIKNEDNIFPLLDSGSNPLASGIMTFEGQATIDSSHVTGYTGGYHSLIPQRSYYAIIHAPGSFEGGYGGISDNLPGGDEGPGTPYARDHAFNSSHNTYIDLDSNGAIDNHALGVILFDQKPMADAIGSKAGGEIGLSGTYYEYPYEDVSFTDDTFNNVEITAIDPQNTGVGNTLINFSVTNDTFTVLPNKAIDVDKTSAFASYGNLFISGNKFAPSQSLGTGIFIYCLDFQAIGLTDPQLAQLTVTDNKIHLVTEEGNQYGIYFDQSDGDIADNAIDGIGYSGFGIDINGYPRTAGQYDGTFICSNSITTGGIYYGILSTSYQGYIKLDSINGVGYGWVHSQLGSRIQIDPPHLVGTQIINCWSNGILAGSTVDLSGCHHNGDSIASDDFPGYNQIHDNTGAQIVITDSANIWVTQDDHIPASSWAQAGHNNIFQGGGSSTTLIQGNGFMNTSVVVDSNYWGPSIVPPLFSPPTTTSWPNYSFTAPFGAIASTPLPSELTCSFDLDATKGKGVKPLSILSLDTASCEKTFALVFKWEENNEDLGLAYDTMKWYITHCYQIANAGETWDAFGGGFDSINQTVAGRQDAFNFVLYGLGLRSDDGWFCGGVSLLGVEFNSGFNGQTPDYRAQRTIYKYLMDNPRCAGYYSGDSTEYYNLLFTQWNIWADSSAPGSTMDSSIPSMQDLGLDTVLALNAKAGVTFALPTPAIINSTSITENPFENSTSVSLSIGREAYVTIGVYNVLGEQVPGAGYAGVFEQGSRTIPLDMTNAPPGAYYVRISTAGSEVQTLKLTKE